MRKLTLICTILCLVTNNLPAQTLFTYGDNKVDKDEFVRIYEKNAINKKPDYSKEALEDYLKLYSIFRMKVKEAEKQQIDTIGSIQSELDNYRRQLAKNYLTDDEVNNKLLKEAYDRMKENLKVEHILILSSPMAASKDTVEPYQRIDSIYKVLQKDPSKFAALAEAYSADKQSAVRGGDIGYITGLQTVYEFENAAYNTPVGKISKPFKTQFGYHVLRVTERQPAKGDIEVAQILISAPKSKGQAGLDEAKGQLKMLQADLKKGLAFEELVKKYSDDQFTKDNDGKLQRFSVGQMVPEFENAAYALKKPGDISEPVKTDYGFHVIKLIKKYPLPPFDSVKKQLQNRIDKDPRSEIARQAFLNDIKKKNDFKEYPGNYNSLKNDFIAKIPTDGPAANTFSPEDFEGKDEALFELKGNKYMQSDFILYAHQVTRGRIMGPREAIFKSIYNNYVENTLQDIEEQNLMVENAEFRNLMNEYRDGIMLFELMDRNVWGKASKDSVGLEAFYEKNKSNYMWDAGYRGYQYTFKNETIAKEGIKMINKGTDPEDILKEMNSKELPDAVRIQKGYYEFAKMENFSQSDIVKGKASVMKKNEDGTYAVAYAEDVYTSKTYKTLDEARGYVIAEYQDYLEKEWNKQLLDKYPVMVSDKTLNSLVQ